MKSVSLILTFILFSTTGFGQGGLDGYRRLLDNTNGIMRYMNRAQTLIEQINSPNMAEAYRLTQGLGERSTTRIQASQCADAYQEFYQKETINMSLHLGYFDGASGGAHDGLFHAAFVDLLTQSCNGKPDGFQLCGFIPNDDNTLLARNITLPTGEVKTINLRINHPSISDDDSQNRVDSTNANPEQAARSRRSADAFYDSIRNGDDAVFYFGHARDGGGPDFDPPHLDASGHTNYPEYRRTHEDFDDLQTALGQRRVPGKPRIMGLMACSTNDHFRTGVQRSAPDMGFVGSNDTANSVNMIASTLTSINSLLTMQCQEDFVHRGSSRVGNTSLSRGNYSVSNFFN